MRYQMQRDCKLSRKAQLRVTQRDGPTLINARLVFFLLICLTCSSCGSDITISMEPSNPPTFRFHKGFFSEVNSFPLFTVEEIDADNQKTPYLEQKYDKNKVLWRIVTDPKASNSVSLDNFPRITYGKVPANFLQEIPQSGSPPILEPGKIYQAGGAYVLMPDAKIRFKIEGGRIF